MPVSEFSTRISKTLLILNTNFVKEELKIGYLEVSNREPHDLEPTVITYYAMVYLQYDGESQTFIYPSSKSKDNPGDLSPSLNCASSLKIHTQRPE